MFFFFLLYYNIAIYLCANDTRAEYDMIATSRAFPPARRLPSGRVSERINCFSFFIFLFFFYCYYFPPSGIVSSPTSLRGIPDTRYGLRVVHAPSVAFEPTERRVQI